MQDFQLVLGHTLVPHPRTTVQVPKTVFDSLLPHHLRVTSAKTAPLNICKAIRVMVMFMNTIAIKQIMVICDRNTIIIIIITIMNMNITIMRMSIMHVMRAANMIRQMVLTVTVRVILAVRAQVQAMKMTVMTICLGMDRGFRTSLME
jgi:hypothetical protein